MQSNLVFIYQAHEEHQRREQRERNKMPNENSHNALNLSHPDDGIRHTENRMHSSSMKNTSGLSSRHHGDRGSQYDGRSGSDDGLPLVGSDIFN